MFDVFDTHIVMICCLWMSTMENNMLQIAKVCQMGLPWATYFKSLNQINFKARIFEEKHM